MSVTRNQPDPSSGNGVDRHIVRVAERPRYTVIDNRAIEDANLSFRALGLLTYLLSKPDNWTVNTEHLASTHREGRDAVRAAMGELIAAHYITQRVMHGEDGRLIWESIVYEQATEKPQVTPSTGNPTPVNPTPENPTLVSTEVVKTDVAKTEELKHSSRFDEFWQAFGLKCGRPKAVDAWKKAIKKADPGLIITAAAVYHQFCETEGVYHKYAQGWLNDERWNDELVSRQRPQTKQDRNKKGLVDWLSNRPPSLHDALRAAEVPDALETSGRPAGVDLIGLTANGRQP